MTLFDLLFIAVFLGSVATILAALTALARGRRDRSGRLLGGLGGILALYLGVVAVVGALAPQRVVPAGQPQCSDDYCVAVAGLERGTSIGAAPRAVHAAGTFYVVHLEVSSRARGRVQRAPDARVYLVDGEGRRYPPSAEAAVAYEAMHGKIRPITDVLRPGESFASVAVFDIPGDARDPALVLAHGGWPGWFVIGESNSLLHKRTILELQRHPGA